jgi:uncharacterized protein
MSKALIIFVRNPVLGKVKTRLAATMGEETALAVYMRLLQHTQVLTRDLPFTKFVYYADFIHESDGWNGYEKRLQAGGDLGTRMQQAFEEVMAMGYQQVCIIGSDCYDLTTAIISTAFTCLSDADTVIGPAQDGGYYLLGMKAPFKNLFENMAWSSDTVFTKTLTIIKAASYSVQLLPVLNDVDEEKDIHFDY